MQRRCRPSLFLVLIIMAICSTVSTENVLQRPASVPGIAHERTTTTRVENLDYSLPKNSFGDKKQMLSLKNSACIQDTNYDTCIHHSYIDGYCSCDSNTSTITVYRGAATSEKDDYYLRYCLDQFAKFSVFRYISLRVENFANMELRGDILGGMEFDRVEFVHTRIRTVDSIFLASSRSVTRVLIMDSIVSDEMPTIEANCLETLDLKFESTKVLKLRVGNFRHLTEIQTLTLISNAKTRVDRNTFRNLPSLQHLELMNSVSLSYGSLAFEPSNSVQKIVLGDVVEVTPGAINNLKNVDLSMHNNTVGWSQAVWFNFLALGGGTLSSRPGQYCIDCQLAWMHRAFLPAAGQIRCYHADRPSSSLDSLPPEFYSHC